MCLLLNPLLGPGSQSSWNWDGWSTPLHHIHGLRVGASGLWSPEGKAGSIPKRDAGLAQGTGVCVCVCWGGRRGEGLGEVEGGGVLTMVPGVLLERKDLRNF